MRCLSSGKESEEELKSFDEEEGRVKVSEGRERERAGDVERVVMWIVWRGEAAKRVEEGKKKMVRRVVAPSTI